MLLKRGNSIVLFSFLVLGIFLISGCESAEIREISTGAVILQEDSKENILEKEISEKIEVAQTLNKESSEPVIKEVSNEDTNTENNTNQNLNNEYKSLDTPSKKRGIDVILNESFSVGGLSIDKDNAVWLRVKCREGLDFVGCAKILQEYGNLRLIVDGDYVVIADKDKIQSITEDDDVASVSIEPEPDFSTE